MKKKILVMGHVGVGASIAAASLLLKEKDAGYDIVIIDDIKKIPADLNFPESKTEQMITETPFTLAKSHAKIYFEEPKNYLNGKKLPRNNKKRK